MKILIFNILLLTAGAVLALKEAESSESGESALDTVNNSGGGGFFSQQSSHSVINSNGNSVVVSRRFNSKGKEESYISIASPKIRIDGEYFTCTSLMCSADAFKCHVSSEAIADDRNSMKTVAECQDKDGKVLDSKETVEENPYPREEPPYSRVADVDRDGSINVQDSNGAQSFTSIRKKLTKEEQEKLDKEVADHTRLVQVQLKHQMDALNEHFNRIFGPGFPFNSAGGPNFPFSNNPFVFGNAFSSGPGFGRPSFDSYDPGFGFENNNWPFMSSFGFPSYPPYRPQVTNNYPYPPYYPQAPNSPPPNSFHPNQHHLTPPVTAQRPLGSEIETNTELDAENDLFEGTTYRSADNNVQNYYDKYRYAHTN